MDHDGHLVDYLPIVVDAEISNLNLEFHAAFSPYHNGDEWDPINSENLFIIQDVQVLPEFRLQGLSRFIINDAINRFSRDADFAVLRVKPPRSINENWDAKMQASTMEAHPKLYDRSVMKHFRSLGFKQYGDTDLMAMFLDEAPIP